MTKERYWSCARPAWTSSRVSLDFPDDRHDDFRGHPGLYEHLNEIIPRCAAHGFDDIVLNTCITSANVDEINGAADKAQKWGVNICYSAYSARRTGCRDYFLKTPGPASHTLRQRTGAAEDPQRRANWIVSAIHDHRGHTAVFRNRRHAGLQSRPALPRRDLRRHAAALLDAVQALSTRRAANAWSASSRHNTCDECYVAIRSNLDKTFAQLLAENVNGFFSFSNDTPGR